MIGPVECNEDLHILDSKQCSIMVGTDWFWKCCQCLHFIWSIRWPACDMLFSSWPSRKCMMICCNLESANNLLDFMLCSLVWQTDSFYVKTQESSSAHNILYRNCHTSARTNWDDLLIVLILVDDPWRDRTSGWNLCCYCWSWKCWGHGEKEQEGRTSSWQEWQNSNTYFSHAWTGK